MTYTYWGRSFWELLLGVRRKWRSGELHEWIGLAGSKWRKTVFGKSRKRLLARRMLAQREGTEDAPGSVESRPPLVLPRENAWGIPIRAVPPKPGKGAGHRDGKWIG